MCANQVGQEPITAFDDIPREGQEPASHLIGQFDYLNASGRPEAVAVHQALSEVASDRRGEISAKSLGRFLTHHKGRIVDGLKLREAEDSHAKQKVWSVEKL